jgi:dipeptidyl aminopeptidase/acylaminoacyl peptidase
MTNGNPPELDLYKSDLARIDVITGDYERILVGRRPLSIHLSPDGHKVAYVDLVGTTFNANAMRFDIAALDVAGGQPRVLQADVFQAAPAGRFLDVGWSPDSRRITFFDSGTGAQHDCYIADVVSGSVQRVGSALHAALESPALANRTFAPAVWVSNTEAYVLVGDRESQTVWRVRPNGESSRVFPTASFASAKTEIAALLPIRPIAMTKTELLVHTRNKLSGNEGLEILSTSTGTLHPEYEQSAALDEAIEESAAGNLLVYSEQRADSPPQLYAADPRFRHRRQLTHLNSNLLGFRLGKSRLVHWHGPNGDTLEGALLLPATYAQGTRYPLIVQIYGGSHGKGDLQSSRKLNTFGMWGPEPYVFPYENLQLFATRGYAVLYADTIARVGTPMYDIAQSLLPGVNEVIDEGVADENRMGLLGHSYGGYSVFSVLVQTDRFKAAIASAGSTNLLDSYSMLWPSGTAWRVGWVEESQGRMGGSLWSRRDRFIENSPLFFLDRVTTPILLMHGTADTAVSIHEGDEAFVSLRRLGKTVQYVQYVGEGHGVAGSTNMRDWAARMLAWYDRYLSPGSVGSTEIQKY